MSRAPTCPSPMTNSFLVEPLENRIAPAAAIFELDSLDGINGFKISGGSEAEFFGWSVSDAGDVNGDGVDDLIVGAILAHSHSGGSYVVFGTRHGFPAELKLSTLNGSNGFKLTGEANGDRAGFSVSAAGDVNGDGFGDLIIGAPQPNEYAYDTGRSYV